MHRRPFVATLGAFAATPAGWLAAAAAERRADTTALAAAWRDARSADAPQQVGVLDLDWQARTVTIRHSTPLPGRAHGLLAEPQERTLLVVAMRPGRWLLRIDERGRIAGELGVDDEPRRFDGHAVASADGAWLYTPETDTTNGRGLVGVRDRRTLRKVDEWPTHGIDPHQLLLDADGHLMLVNGGIPRSPDGAKRDLDRMASSLVRLDARDGRLLGRWTLDDPRLSLRHLAWSRGRDGEPLLGIALQAEHDDPRQRREAPVLAVFDGRSLAVPSRAADAGGYAGDIAPAVEGGFALSGQRANRAVVWQPQQASRLSAIAEVEDPCALAPQDGGVLVAAAHGVGRWHPRQPGAMLRWPQPMALDNHWVVL